MFLRESLAKLSKIRSGDRAMIDRRLERSTANETKVSIAKLKKNPLAAIRAGGGGPVGVWSREEPLFYCVPADVYEVMIKCLEDLELIHLVESRQDEQSISVSLDDL